MKTINMKLLVGLLALGLALVVTGLVLMVALG
jgi:hypothetical protein